MSAPIVPPKLTPIWTPDDFRQVAHDIRHHTPDDTSEFDADMAFLYGLADALFEFAPPAVLRAIAEKDAS